MAEERKKLIAASTFFSLSGSDLLISGRTYGLNAGIINNFVTASAMCRSAATPFLPSFVPS